jgi:hypothetical protein
MKLNRKKLRSLILEEFDLLLEQEDPPVDEEETTEEEPEEPTDDEVTGDETEETTEETVEDEVTPEEEKVLIKTADDQIQHMIVDFESEAIKSAQLQQQESWRKGSLVELLFEQEGIAPDELGSSEIDLQNFASNVARLIMNYDSLLDMEALIINKAMMFLEDKYDETTATQFEAILGDQFQIALVPYTDEEETMAPIAIGAMGGEGT